MTGLIGAQIISPKGYLALMFRLLISLLLLSLTTEIVTTMLSWVLTGFAQKIKNPHQPMIPYFPYSKNYSPIDLPHGTLSNCWNTAQSLVDKRCGVQPWSVWYHKTWVPWSYYQHLVIGLSSSFVISQSHVEDNKRWRWRSPIFFQHCCQIYSWWLFEQKLRPPHK